MFWASLSSSIIKSGPLRPILSIFRANPQNNPILLCNQHIIILFVRIGTSMIGPKKKFGIILEYIEWGSICENIRSDKKTRSERVSLVYKAAGTRKCHKLIQEDLLAGLLL